MASTLYYQQPVMETPPFVDFERPLTPAEEYAKLKKRKMIWTIVLWSVIGAIIVSLIVVLLVVNPFGNIATAKKYQSARTASSYPNELLV
jgi:hypothetical protein